MSANRAETESFSPLQWGWVVILAITLLRLAALGLTQLQLYPDEAQYWVWSQTFDWGYFSKPPLIAWVISLSTAIFGDTDFAIRLPSVLFHAMGAGFLLMIAHDLKKGWAGLWAALIYLTMPGIAISAAVISTDALLLPLTAGALFMLMRLRAGGGWSFAIGLGIFTGLAFLAKYAAIYFIVGTGLAVLLDPQTRRALLSLRGLLAGAILLAFLGPNLAWNAANDFATVQHTAANANWQGSLFNVSEFLEFVGGQFGVFGFLLFPLLITAAIIAWRHWRDPEYQIERILTLFGIPALLVVAGQAFISRAHANWAASAYVAGTLLVLLFLLRGPAWRRYVMAASIAAGSLFWALTAIVGIQPSLVAGNNVARGVRHLQSWPETVTAIRTAAESGDFNAIVFDDRNVFHQMQRYGGDWPVEIRMWQRYAAPHNHAEAVWGLDENTHGPFLIVSERAYDRARLVADFGGVERIGEIAIPTGGHADRRFTLYEATTHNRVPRTAEYEARQAEANAADNSSE
ncbi:glycosyltransferase family 39 protein [Hyphobacterium sp. HN65]|uniref:Glycosyltransferase family 39 protein n=1 Tax=Hyphobacterium lacteum TaxID=3116575 RepID=A0ABU7LNS1_9PROT|nr:glycosyltransferase family 39 protein [Hyphobacterium sp. HN65]MEE2525555.1 glycosyltransferase family 39 protein [Hyphobacterium sp. HN65]